MVNTLQPRQPPQPRGAAFVLILLSSVACDMSRFERDGSRTSDTRASDAAIATDSGSTPNPTDGGRRAGRSVGDDGGHDSGSESAKAGASGETARREGNAGMSGADESDAGESAAGGTGGSAADGGSSGTSTPPEGATADPVPADPILWFHAGEVVLDADGKVSAWPDKGARELDARPPSAAAAPKPVTVDSRTWLEFTGNEELVLPKIPPLPQLSIFIVTVARDDGGPKCPSLLHFANPRGAVTQANIVDFGRHMEKLWYKSGDSTQYADAAHAESFTIAEPHVVGVVHGEDRRARLRIDSTTVGEAEMSLPGAAERELNFIGENYFYVDSNTKECDKFVGLIGEILVYSRALDDAEVDALEQHLQVEWGIAR